MDYNSDSPKYGIKLLQIKRFKALNLFKNISLKLVLIANYDREKIAFLNQIIRSVV